MLHAGGDYCKFQFISYYFLFLLTYIFYYNALFTQNMQCALASNVEIISNIQANPEQIKGVSSGDRTHDYLHTTYIQVI